MELKDKSFEDIANQIIYLQNFGQKIPIDLKIVFLARYFSEINTIKKEDLKQEVIRFYERNKSN